MGETFWQGEYASEKLGLTVNAASNQVLALESLVGVALRKNPKRAHLLVSKVLGKHYPQSPTIIRFAASVLAYSIVQDLLFRDLSVQAAEIESNRWKKTLDDVLNGDWPIQQLNYMMDETFPEDWNKLVVFGYAETATALGASIADDLSSYYVNSTRYPDKGAVRFGGFEEEHSHASSHHLTPKDSEFLEDETKTLVLVDDELTTGKTILNTIKMLHARVPRKEYMIATLVDLRDDAARETMDKFAAELGIDIRIFSLFSGHLNVPASAVDEASAAIEEIKTAGLVPETSGRNAAVFVNKLGDAAPNPKNGLTFFDELNQKAADAADLLKKLVVGKTLILGLEEDMYFALQTAHFLEKARFDVSYSTTTRSPVVAYDNDGYAIKDRIKFYVPEVEGDTSKRFAYNIGHDFDSIVIITDSSKDTAKLTTPETNLIDALKTRTRNIFIMEAAMNTNNLQEPLTSPEFGSYSSDDVKWLLKDLSHAELEGGLEEREEAIQNGGAHYAESLPVEYQPSEEYQQIFLDSLENKKFELAISTGVLAEQIYRRRNAHPVLVSLARAGTPVGVLLKRYLKAAYGIDAPHYAVSIVRGKGIDVNAMNYIAANHDAENVVFVDGWSGKGKITKELTAALEEYEKQTGVHFSSELAVISDPAHCTDLYGTRDDFLIPSATLNSTVSGLISRTVLNTQYIGEHDYHGAKFYADLAEKDFSNLFVDTISELFTEENIIQASKLAESHVPQPVDWAGWATVERISKEYGVPDLNLIKPGSAETTRVLLRRVPELVLIRPDKYDELKHIVLLAENRGARIELVEDLPYASIGIIKPLKKGEVE